ncbi:MAG: 4-alpha-glucanotransferase [Defluviitaleaceae bacterium]|nr:4-alpha-glucanotransferase [Defluviitaleaceae bacterium]
MFDIRLSGILAHPTSFPGPFGIGDLGAGAYQFIDFLSEAKQKLWQVLPLGPTGYGDSPYQSFSSFAGNHYMISPELLVEQGWLTVADLVDPGFDPRAVDYGSVIEYKMNLLKKAYTAFKIQATQGEKNCIIKFARKHKHWLPDYALFVALKGYHGGESWMKWAPELSHRDPKAMAEMKIKLADEINFTIFLQYEFYRQWGLLRAYANKHGIQIIGDIPIFVAMDSADIWANPHLFQLGKDGNPSAIAGVPPDYFSETGQLWGNPLYKWEAHKETGFEWWCQRFSAVLGLVDVIRIDHFRGFESYWSVPFGSETAEKGKWIKGPGKTFFAALKARLGQLPIIAEDLGIITPAVNKLRHSLGLPGMKVLHFAFDPEAKSDYLPHMYNDKLTIVYTGTHDNDTTIGWYESASEEEKDYLRRYMNISGEDISWDMIRLAFSTSAIYAIVPIQDVMSLGTENRMNQPGCAMGWWRFRYTVDMLREEYAQGLSYLSELFHRNEGE